jgi:hypothetical protein
VRKSTPFFIALIVLLVFGGLALAMQDSQKPDKIDKDKCLGCHGPFDKIIKATANWESPAGDKASPHKYVPHDSEDAPECTECHTPHAIPLKDKALVVKPKDVLFCYDSCHHAKNLQPCKNCH